jgi:hypothetical protein
MEKKNDTLSPLVTAKYLVMEANLLENSSSTEHQYEQLMEEAIRTVKKQDVFH